MSAYDLVSEHFLTATGYAEEAWDIATTGLNSLLAEASFDDVETTALDFTFSPVDESMASVTPPDKPDVPTIDTTVPVRDNFMAVPTIAIDIPSKQYNFLDISVPTKPSVTDPTDPGDAAEVYVPTNPELSYTVPDRPSIRTDFTMPAKPEYDIPAFDATAPTDNIGDLSVSFNWEEPPEYTSPLLTAVKAKLLSDLQAGGTGLGEDAEEAIWNRALDRQAEIDEKLYADTMEFFSSRGWNMPSGALIAKLAEAHNESRRSTEKLNNDILVQQSQLAYQNVKDTINASIGLEGALLNYSNAVAQRGLEAANTLVQASIAIYNAKIARFNQLLETYKTKASVYQVLVQAQGLIVELYNSELKSVQLEQAVEIGKLEVYKQDWAAVGMLIDAWKSQLQGNAMILEGEKLKLDAHRQKIEIFTAKLQAITQKYNAYQTEAQVEGIKAQINSEMVKAYAVDVDAAKTEASIAEVKVNAVTAYNKNIVDEYAANIEAFKAGIQAQTAYIEAVLKKYTSEGAVYDSDIKRVIALAQNNTSVNESNLKLYLSKMELLLKQAEVDINRALEENKMRIEASKAAAAVAAQMAAGALSSANAQAHVSGSRTESWDNTKSEPTYSYNHHYTT